MKNTIVSLLLCATATTAHAGADDHVVVTGVDAPEQRTADYYYAQMLEESRERLAFYETEYQRQKSKIKVSTCRNISDDLGRQSFEAKKRAELHDGPRLKPELSANIPGATFNPDGELDYEKDNRSAMQKALWASLMEEALKLSSHHDRFRDKCDAAIRNANNK